MTVAYSFAPLRRERIVHIGTGGGDLFPIPMGARLYDIPVTFTMRKAREAFEGVRPDSGRPGASEGLHHPSYRSGLRTSSSWPKASARTRGHRSKVCSPAWTTKKRSSLRSARAACIERVIAGAAVRLNSNPRRGLRGSRGDPTRPRVGAP